MKRTTYAVEATETNLKLVTSKFTTNNTSDPDGLEGNVLSVTRTAAGAFTVLLKEPIRCPQLLGIAPHVVSTAGTIAHVKTITSSNGAVTGFTMELRKSALAAYTTGVAVTTNVATLSIPGRVVLAEATTATAAGVKTIQSTASPAAGAVQVTYTAGVATLTFNGTDAVTVATVLVDTDDTVSDTTDEDIYVLCLLRNSALTTR